MGSKIQSGKTNPPGNEAANETKKKITAEEVLSSTQIIEAMDKMKASDGVSASVLGLHEKLANQVKSSDKEPMNKVKATVRGLRALANALEKLPRILKKHDANLLSFDPGSNEMGVDKNPEKINEDLKNEIIRQSKKFGKKKVTL